MALDPRFRWDEERMTWLFELPLREDGEPRPGIIRVVPTMKTASPATTEFATS